MNSNVHPMWFGPGDRPIFGVAHIPESQPRGAVVICPPLAKEHVNTYRGVKLLAQELCAAGFVALRFDYYGVGDSSGSQLDDHAVEHWLESVDEALDWVRDIGCEATALIGLRAGALLADRAAARAERLDAVVLWDPVATGRAYLREQQAFYTMSIDNTDNTDDSVDEVPLIGMNLTKEAAGALASLSIEAAAPSVDRWLFALREGVHNKRLTTLVESSNADVIEVDGMQDFVTPGSFLVTIAESAIDAIVSWLDETMPVARSSVNAAFRTTAVLESSSQMPAVVETIERLGKENIFAIRSRCAEKAAESGHSLLMCATANDTRIGPTRIWVELARDAAALGAEALRFDRRGTGESGRVERAEHTAIYSDESMNDVVVAASAVVADPDKFVATGICSGSWYAAYATRELGAGSVVWVNAVAWSWRRKRSARGKIVPSDMGVPRSDPEWQRTPRARVKAFLQRNLPYWCWKMLGSSGVTQVPEVMLGSLSKLGIDQTVVLAPGDYRWFLDQRGEEGLARLRKYQAVPTLVTPLVGDHSGYHRAVRQAISRHVLEKELPHASISSHEGLRS